MLYLNIWLTVKDAADVEKVSRLLAEAGAAIAARAGLRAV